ncbi:hypothetical protein K469DRAFT_216534 [Zopfia rhizophila CBS 207.26]|uniref:Uncharacterized protein n=1 Tax=Zopfia rhizophila CBS 207.26 TaxID=1314779 RepID=A0A6A6E002_9PEZI|nr:hypothetical protein K469DRAFT_216534 [Zopfia rhizophila CBS 207.26]
MSRWRNIFPGQQYRTVRERNEAIALLSLSEPNNSSVTEPEERGVTVHDGERETKNFSDEDKLRNYLEQFPEANNDQATRVFQFGPNCATTLKLALFNKFRFLQLSMTPRGLTEIPGNVGLMVAQCGCDRCKAGTSCSYHALECAFSFWQHSATSADVENRLEVTGNNQTFAIYAGGGQKSTFQLATCSLQFFRFPSRILEHTDCASDALIYFKFPIQFNLTTVRICASNSGRNLD